MCLMQIRRNDWTEEVCKCTCSTGTRNSQGKRRHSWVSHVDRHRRDSEYPTRYKSVKMLFLLFHRSSVSKKNGAGEQFWLRCAYDCPRRDVRLPPFPGTMDAASCPVATMRSTGGTQKVSPGVYVVDIICHMVNKALLRARKQCKNSRCNTRGIDAERGLEMSGEGDARKMPHGRRISDTTLALTRGEWARRCPQQTSVADWHC
ncbi:hypothetical protein EV363DRAFT_383626 [Boletus edulis]|nr:hypothetical protein EV363DRAFT_383626 [Boletus edulis]